MPTYLTESTDLASQAYRTKSLDLFIDLSEGQALVSATLHFELDERYSNTNEQLILKGHGLTLLSVALNNTPLQCDQYSLTPRKHTLVIKKPAKQGQLNIRAYIDISKLAQQHGVYFSPNGMFFSGTGRNIEYLTYFPRHDNNEILYTITLCSPRSAYPVLLASGLLLQSELSLEQRQTITYQHTIPESLDKLFIAFCNYSLVQYNVTNSDFTNTCLINVYVKPQYIAGTKIAINVIKSCCEWLSNEMNSSLIPKIFSIVATAIPAHGYQLFENVLLCDEYLCLATQNTATDSQIYDIYQFLAKIFFENLCTISPDSGLSSELLTNNFLKVFFGSIYESGFADEHNFKATSNAFWLNAISKNANSCKIFELPQDFIDRFKAILLDNSLPPNVKAELLTLPSFNELASVLDEVDFDIYKELFQYFVLQISNILEHELYQEYINLPPASNDEFTPYDFGTRKLKNLLLWYLMQCNNNNYIELATNQILLATNLNDRVAAYEAIASNPENDDHEFDSIIRTLLQIRCTNAPIQLEGNHLVTAKFVDPNTYAWMSEIVATLPAWHSYLLLKRFCNENSLMLHKQDGSGYLLLINSIIRIDSVDNNLAINLLSEFEIAFKLDHARKNLVIKYLSQAANAGISAELRLAIEDLHSRIITERNTSTISTVALLPKFSMNNPQTWSIKNGRGERLFPDFKKQLRHGDTIYARDRRCTLTQQMYEAIASPQPTPTPKP
jgi:aminopeptidase N